ncbi:MAG: hypothetical protein L0H96_02440 [Humibacillus sp.]|nr:hypothetical protein [Humibacillus sp.]MDN5775750.1 hypothetical protein [Humibacillus sp.]
MALQTPFSEELRTPRSAAIAGIAFALILATVIVLLRWSGPASDGGGTAWLTDAQRRSTVSTALNLVPFAGIAFLWFIGVVRSRLGAREDKLFATVFLGSGLLFVALLFAGAAAIHTALTLETSGGSADTVRLAQTLSSVLLGTFGARMAAVFVLSVTTLGLRTRIVPRWLVALGYVAAAALFLSPPISGWSQLVFPAWVLTLSVQILLAGARDPHPQTAAADGS